LTLILGIYSPLSIAAMPPVSLVGLSWAMEPSDREVLTRSVREATVDLRASGHEAAQAW
jgi:hypothetical protein